MGPSVRSFVRTPLFEMSIKMLYNCHEGCSRGFQRVPKGSRMLGLGGFKKVQEGSRRFKKVGKVH